MIFLNIEEILKKVKFYSYPKNEYWVTAGAGLVLHGVKYETADIDMGCTTMLADMTIQNGAKWSFLDDGNRIINVADDIDLFENWFVDNIIEIDGICVASLESIRRQKIKLNRSKDWDDIALIDIFLSGE